MQVVLVVVVVVDTLAVVVHVPVVGEDGIALRSTQPVAVVANEVEAAITTVW
jgi:hypothetical protein